MEAVRWDSLGYDECVDELRLSRPLPSEKSHPTSLETQGIPGPGIPRHLLRTTGDDAGGQDRRDGGCRFSQMTENSVKMKNTSNRVTEARERKINSQSLVSPNFLDHLTPTKFLLNGPFKENNCLPFHDQIFHKKIHERKYQSLKARKRLGNNGETGFQSIVIFLTVNSDQILFHYYNFDWQSTVTIFLWQTVLSPWTWWWDPPCLWFFLLLLPFSLPLHQYYTFYWD